MVEIKGDHCVWHKRCVQKSIGVFCLWIIILEMTNGNIFQYSVYLFIKVSSLYKVMVFNSKYSICKYKYINQ